MAHSSQTGITIDHDGVHLLGTLFLAAGANPKATALILHGIPGIEKNYDLAHMLRAQGFNSLIFHYRGCWGSSGAYNVHTIPQDVKAAVDLLASGQFGLVNPDRLFLIGHSLGGWAGVLAAAADERIKAAAVIGSVTSRDLFPLDDPEYALGYTPWLSHISPEDLAKQWRSLGSDLNPVDQVAKIAPRPLFIIHSVKDKEVDVENSRQLAARAGNGSRYLETPEGDHGYSWERPWLQETLLDWIREVLYAGGNGREENESNQH